MCSNTTTVLSDNLPVKVQKKNHMRLWCHCRVTRAKTQGFGIQACVCVLLEGKTRYVCIASKNCPLKKEWVVFGFLPFPVHPAHGLFCPVPWYHKVVADG